MTDLDEASSTALASWRFTPGTGDWNDVRERAGLARPGPGGATRRAARRVRWQTLAAGALLLAALLVVPEFGVGARLKALLLGSPRPGLLLTTDIVRSDGMRVGSFSVRTSRLSFQPATARGGAPIRWTLELGERASEAVVLEPRRGGRGPVMVARLCKPCTTTETGTLRLPRRALAALLDRGLAVAVSGPQGTGRGVPALQAPGRR